jgi:quercetin dioxygenase-like cupin family protein
MPDRFEDARGVIQDLLGPVDAVTEIRSKADAVRGNHVHARTQQWTYVVSGVLLVASQPGVVQTREVAEGEFFLEPAGVPHAWKSLTDSTVLVFTCGPRSGEAYESDTTRLEVPILT